METNRRFYYSERFWLTVAGFGVIFGLTAMGHLSDLSSTDVAIMISALVLGKSLDAMGTKR